MFWQAGEFELEFDHEAAADQIHATGGVLCLAAA